MPSFPHLHQHGIFPQFMNSFYSLCANHRKNLNRSILGFSKQGKTENRTSLQSKGKASIPAILLKARGKKHPFNFLKARENREHPFIPSQSKGKTKTSLQPSQGKGKQKTSLYSFSKQGENREHPFNPSPFFKLSCNSPCF
jgi:hypothetical protein